MQDSLVLYSGRPFQKNMMALLEVVPEDQEPANHEVS
jgi:hypothetical protein